MPIITDKKVDFEFKDRNLEFLNQPVFYIPFITKTHLPKPKIEKHINKKKIGLAYSEASPILIT